MTRYKIFHKGLVGASREKSIPLLCKVIKGLFHSLPLKGKSITQRQTFPLYFITIYITNIISLSLGCNIYYVIQICNIRYNLYKRSCKYLLFQYLMICLCFYTSTNLYYLPVIFLTNTSVYL